MDIVPTCESKPSCAWVMDKVRTTCKRDRGSNGSIHDLTELGFGDYWYDGKHLDTIWKTVSIWKSRPVLIIG